MRPRDALAVPILLLVLAACAGDPSEGGLQPSDPGSARDRALHGRTFASTGVTVDGEPRPLVGGTSAVVGFTDEGLTLHAGCNQLSAQAAYADGRLTVAGVGSTDMGCARPLMNQDAWLAGFLADDPRYALDGDTLSLTSGDTAMTLEPQPDEPAAELAGTRWRLEGIVDGGGPDASVSRVPGGSSLVLEVTGDGWLTADLGCNSGGGRVDVARHTLHVGDFPVTLVGCGGARARLERLVSRVVGTGDIAYVVDGDVLTLTRGGSGLVYRAN
jgi:heat shock protein HslJ